MGEHVFAMEHDHHQEILRPNDPESLRLIHRLWKGDGEDLLKRLLGLPGLEKIEVHSNGFTLFFESGIVHKRNADQLLTTLGNFFAHDRIKFI